MCSRPSRVRSASCRRSSSAARTSSSLAHSRCSSMVAWVVARNRAATITDPAAKTTSGTTQSTLTWVKLLAGHVEDRLEPSVALEEVVEVEKIVVIDALAESGLEQLG